MPKIIYEQNLLMGEETNMYYEYLADRTKPELVEKVINRLSNHYSSISYIIKEHILKPKEIDFEKIYSDIENNRIEFHRSNFNIKMTKTLFTDDLHGIDGLRSLEIIYFYDDDDRWKVDIIFIPPRKNLEIEDEIHALYLRNEGFDYKHRLRIFNNLVFLADIRFNDDLIR